MSVDTLRADFTTKLVHVLPFGTPKFYIAPYDKIKHELVNLSSNCDVKSGLRATLRAITIQCMSADTLRAITIHCMSVDTLRAISIQCMFVDTLRAIPIQCMSVDTLRVISF